jgi:hypothetical protein
MRDILLRNRSVGADLPAPVVDPLSYLPSLLHEVEVGVEGLEGVPARLSCVVVVGSVDVHLLYQKKTTLVARLHFRWILLCGQTTVKPIPGYPPIFVYPLAAFALTGYPSAVDAHR